MEIWRFVQEKLCTLVNKWPKTPALSLVLKWKSPRGRKWRWPCCCGKISSPPFCSSSLNKKSLEHIRIITHLFSKSRTEWFSTLRALKGIICIHLNVESPNYYKATEHESFFSIIDSRRDLIAVTASWKTDVSNIFHLLNKKAFYFNYHDLEKV